VKLIYFIFLLLSPFSFSQKTGFYHPDLPSFLGIKGHAEIIIKKYTVAPKNWIERRAYNKNGKLLYIEEQIIFYFK
jgi:hypothetical protein